MAGNKRPHRTRFFLCGERAFELVTELANSTNSNSKSIIINSLINELIKGATRVSETPHWIKTRIKTIPSSVVSFN